MRHPTDGTLRRLVDEPAGVTDTDREHVAGCPVCLAGLAEAQRDAAAVGAALGATPGSAPGADLDTAWRRLSTAVTAEPVPPAAAVSPAATSPARRWKSRLRSPVVAGVRVAVLLAGGGAAAATDWFQIFRTEQVAPLSLSQADLVQIPDLSAYGDLEVVTEPEVRAADAETAEEETGLAVPEVGTLPRGVVGDPEYQVGSVATAVFTFVFAWNDFIFALVLTRTEVTTYTVQVTHYFGGQSNFWSKISAMSVLGTIPIFIAVAFMQRYLVRGISLGAVKG